MISQEKLQEQLPDSQADTGRKTVFIKSYGCQMNVYDSQRMADTLTAAGYSEVTSAEGADLVILNTCHIREKAAEKVYSELGRLRNAQQERRRQGRDLKIAVAGCVAQAEGEEILRRAPAVDLVVGPQAYHRLPDMLERANRTEKPVDTEFPVEDKFTHLPAPRGEATRARGPSAFVTAQEGCDKFCTFCVVPYTRGAETSRPVASITAEVERLTSAGVCEITLLGQNVNAYHGEGPDGRSWTLGRLLHHLAGMANVKRLRYTTSHPQDMDDSLIEAHRDLPALMPFLHLPVQSGSDRILAAMNRRHTAAEYLALIEKIRHARPDMAFSSDFIVGFPGETDADFDATMRLIEQVGYVSAYAFKYSPRPGTPGATFENQVDEDIKSARLARLQAATESRQKAFNEASIGQVIPVLFDRKGKHPGQIAGRSPYLQAVQVEGPQTLLGSMSAVRITHTGAWSLHGQLEDSTTRESSA